MRIVVTSDLHFNPQWYGTLRILAVMIRELEPELFIMAGDVGEPLDLFTSALKAFVDVAPLRAVIAGNHDVWHRTAPHTSQELWETALPEVARTQGYIWLEGRNLTLGNDLGVCGTIAWYDYSARRPELELSSSEYRKIKSLITNDAQYIDWPWSDEDFATTVGQAFEARLDALENDPDIEEIVVVTHVPLFMDLLRRSRLPEQDIANAYYGNLPLGERILQRRKVRAIISGHTHIDRRVSIPRDGLPEVTAYVVPADYGHPAALCLDTDTWTAQSIFAPTGR
jgi:3',5'-cyclic AMP phosphodiesterase CpdA